MTRIAATAQPILNDAQPELLKTHFLPVVEKLDERTAKVFKAEEDLKKDYPMGGQEMEEAEYAILEDYHLIVRDLYAFYPLLIKFVDSQRAQWLKSPTIEAEKLYYKVAAIFNSWAKSANFRREEQNYVAQTEVDSSSVLASAMSKSSSGGGSFGGGMSPPGEPPKPMSTTPKRPDGQQGSPPSLILAALKRLLPIGMNQYGAREQELVQQAKIRYGQKETDKEVRDFLFQQLHLQEKEKVEDMARMKAIEDAYLSSSSPTSTPSSPPSSSSSSTRTYVTGTAPGSTAHTTAVASASGTAPTTTTNTNTNTNTAG
ncbi:ryanodine receptor 3-like [Diadema antillarum]|uniref:ryanodine receptor 3-like n=1 Tax=Diadema antillarum TaxID=105358 RepID=UPI003A858D2D